MMKFSLFAFAMVCLCVIGCAEEKKKVVVVDPPEKGGVSVDAGGVSVDAGKGGVEVKTPTTNVDVDTKK
jgi:hypothetical protein